MQDAINEVLARIDGSARGRRSLKIRTLLGLFGYQAQHRVRAESLDASLAALSAAGISHHLPSGRGADDYITLARGGAVEAAVDGQRRVATLATAAAGQGSHDTPRRPELLVPGQLYRVLSLHGPWAWAVVFGGKDVENRKRRTPYRGRILIHASLRHLVGESLVERRELLGTRVGSGGQIPSTFPRSRIIGSVELVDCVARDVDSPWAEPGYVHWLLRDPQPVAWDAHVDGKLNLWKWTCPER